MTVDAAGPAATRDAGDSALVLTLGAAIDPEINARAVAAADALAAARIDGVRDVVPTYCAVTVHFDPLRADAAAIETRLREAAAAPAAVQRGRVHEVPAIYGGESGPDLDEVARFAGLGPREVVERHAGRDYRVFMLGFLPGFAYLGPVAPEIAAPRRGSPRARVAAGSIGIAGPQTAIYPQASPGGWQIIGRTALTVFDPDRTPPCRFAPGDTVRFVPVQGEAAPAAARSAPRAADATEPSGRHVTVLQPGLFTTVQDAGRWGHQASGTPVAGAMDLVAHRSANALVGNDDGAATLEATLVGPELRIESEALLAITGADLEPTLDGARVPHAAATRCRAGSVLRFGRRRRGARAYVAFDGGIGVDPVLGSRSTHVLSGLGGLGGRPLAAGDRVPLGAAGEAPGRRPVEMPATARRGGAVVRVLPGPQREEFPDRAIDRLQQGRFSVSAQSDRMGYRLEGSAIPRLPREMISDATFTGGIQVPASGQPIVLMADRQTTGGYPQIATVITADLPLVAQLAPGDWIAFEVCTRREALRALLGQEGALLALR